MNFKVLLNSVGATLIIIGLIMLVPGIYSELDQQLYPWAFFSSGFAAIVLGACCWFSTRRNLPELNHRTGFAIVTLAWLLACILGAFPYYLSGTTPTFAAALFESTSGFTGTGATILTNIEAVAPELLLWRSMTQWLGGMGIVVFFLAILPLLGMGGVQLFRAETTGPNKDKITPRVRDTAKQLWFFYLSLTGFLALILSSLGMSAFDAINHAMTTMATGGFSTRNGGIGAFSNPMIDYVIAAFMLIGSISFSLHYRLIVRRDRRALFDTELKAYLGILGFCVLLFTLINWTPVVYDSLEESFRYSLFSVVAIASSTGYTNVDYTAWPLPTHLILMLLMVMGGMSGSTAGGMKCIRLVAAFKLILKDLKQVVHPNAILGVKSNGRLIRPEVANAIWGFMFLYLFCFSVLAFFLSFEDGMDTVTAVTAALSALSNIGPAFGDFGPMNNFSTLSTDAKLMFSGAMLIGRLEFFTVILILTPEFWRR